MWLSRRQVWIKHRHIRHWYRLRLSFPRLKLCWMLKRRLVHWQSLRRDFPSFPPPHFLWGSSWDTSTYDIPEVTQSFNRRLREMTANHFSNAVTCLECVEFSTYERAVPHNLSQLEASVLGKLENSKFHGPCRNLGFQNVVNFISHLWRQQCHLLLLDNVTLQCVHSVMS